MSKLGSYNIPAYLLEFKKFNIPFFEHFIAFNTCSYVGKNNF